MNTQKIQSRGFTLVELIVVITILVILGTIAFINLGGQSASARDSKRTSDVRNLVSQVNIKQTAGVSLVDMVSTGAINQIAAASLILGGSGGVAFGTEYQAGSPNLTLLGLSADAFKDAGSTSQAYTMGATSKVGGAYQIAATLEGDSAKTALVMGIYTPRVAANTASGTVTGTSLKLSQGIGTFRVGDWIASTTAVAVGTGQITNISSDLTTITTSVALTATATTFKIATNEVGGLIREQKNAAGATLATSLGVVNGSGATLPY